MNFVAYEFRRGHRSMENKALDVLREAAETVPELEHMTPTRFDVLTAIAEKAWWERKPGPRSCPTNVMPMADLRKMLGLHHATVTMIIRRMKAWGLVVTAKPWHDKRTTVIMMTEAGWQALKAARRLLRQRPQNFLRVPLGNWFRRLGMRDSIGSMRIAQNWAKSLAEELGMFSTPIHDPRCDLGWHARRQPVASDDSDRVRWTQPPTRRRSYG